MVPYLERQVRNVRKRPMLAWLFVGAVAVLLSLLGLLQYRWIGEVSLAERATMRNRLDQGLKGISQAFDTEIASAATALLPSDAGTPELTDEALVRRYLAWEKASAHPRLFRRVDRARKLDGAPELASLDPDRSAFRPTEWPVSWQAVRQYLLTGETPEGARTVAELSLVILPVPRQSGSPREWMILEFDTEYLRSTVLPDLLRAHLPGSNPESGNASDWEAEVVGKDNPSLSIAGIGPDGPSWVGAHPDASIGMFSVPRGLFSPRRRRAEGGDRERERESLTPRPDWGRWLLLVRHRAGSLDAVVDRSRRLNLGVTAAVFVLLLLTTMALVRFTRRAQRLAGLQMEFVAGVSHELRTPLSVVRTAAHNMAEGVIRDADEMRSYGVLIEDEIGKLTSTVEQVLRFSRLESVQSVTPREPVDVNLMIERAVAGSSEALKEAGVIPELHVEDHLPPVQGDAAALQQALQNLIENAVKYGRDGGWMEVRALVCKMSDGFGVEIAVKDRGQGLSAADLEMVFVPFFRGRRAIAEQIHGTGLGLSLVKRTIEGHGGTVIAVSEPGSGAEFVMRIPVETVQTE